MELASWVQIASMTGCSTLTYLVVANTKELPGIKKIPSFLWAVFIATIALIFSNLALGASIFDWQVYCLAFFNSWFVASVAGKMNDGSTASMQNKVNDNIESK